MLTVGSLFSGVGMFDLGFHLAGFQIAWQCDFDPYCQAVLKARQDVFGNTTIYGDVKELGKGRKYEPQPVDVLIGGFPCQPFSIAGKRQGENDSRNGWDEFARLIGELRPKAIMLENVPAITLDYGLRVVADVTALGYDAQWGIISANDAGAPHKRERWWLVGYANSFGLCGSAAADQGRLSNQYGGDALEVGEIGSRVKSGATGETIPDGNSPRLERINREQSQVARNTESSQSRQRQLPQPRMGRSAHGTAHRLDGHKFPNGLGESQHADEPPRTIAEKPANWKHRIKALGNGGLPQIAYEIAICIKDTLG